MGVVEIFVPLKLPSKTGLPRGFGFIEMDDAAAMAAQQALDGKEMDGRALKVNEAQDKPRGGGASICVYR